jgi:hypothetical protein
MDDLARDLRGDRARRTAADADGKESISKIVDDVYRRGHAQSV